MYLSAMDLGQVTEDLVSLPVKWKKYLKDEDENAFHTMTPKARQACDKWLLVTEYLT